MDSPESTSVTNGAAPSRPRGSAATGFGRRLGYFLLGTSIGLVMLGYIQMRRQAAAGSARAQQQVESDPVDDKIVLPPVPSDGGEPASAPGVPIP